LYDSQWPGSLRATPVADADRRIQSGGAQNIAVATRYWLVNLISSKNSAMLILRPAEAADLPVIWALSVLPNAGHTANPNVPFPLPPAKSLPKRAFSDLADPYRAFASVGGKLIVAELNGHLAAMGGFRPSTQTPGRVEILRVRTHPARRRLGLGTAVLRRLEADALAHGYREAWLDTATNQPEAMAFYSSTGYHEIGRETRPEWNWTLVYYLKHLEPPR
jgi:ribosomal protein S18 acetylase RimI-like enzyme